MTIGTRNPLRCLLALGFALSTVHLACSQDLLVERFGMQVIAPHLFAMTFSAKNTSTLTDFRTGGTSDSSTHAGKTLIYRLPLPDFIPPGNIELVTLAAIFPNPSGVRVQIGGRPAMSSVCPSDLPASTRKGICAPAVSLMSTSGSGREVVIEITTEDGKDALFAQSQTPSPLVLFVQTSSILARPVGWSTPDLSATTEMPPLKPLFDYDLRDTSIGAAPDGFFYLTGSTGSPDIWAVTSDIQLWKSPDLKNWTPVITSPRMRSVVWSIDREGTWQRAIAVRDGAPFRPLWAPEIHYLKGTFWIPYSIPRLGTGLLKSSTGKPEGPYVSAIKPDRPLTDGIDASMFEDDDGTVYFLWAGGMIARMKADLSGLDEAPHQLRPANAPMVGFEGVSLFKFKGRYYLSAADFTNGDYNCFTASSSNINGPYSDRYISVPHGGHNNFFQDHDGTWWSTFFGNDVHAPFRERPAIVRMHFDMNGELKPQP